MKNKFILIIFLFLYTACQEQHPTTTQSNAPFFKLTSSAENGIQFSNDLTASVELNVFNYMYFYNGGGLGAGDFNNDGLIDLFFSGNQVDNALYLNKGDLKFEEVSKTANINVGKGWANGVSVVDINNDGRLDIYVSQVGAYEILKNTHRLYVCVDINADGVPIYEEKAAEYGLDIIGFGTQGVFFDYDLDGDLDLFQLHHSVHANGTFGKRKSFMDEPHPLAGDKLFQNKDGKYEEVTQAAGIFSSVIGYGLGAIASDINLDGYPDLYVTNDFHENDYLYINQGDGTFKEELTQRIKQTSRFSMGVDIADISGDAYPEIFSLDMHPEDPYILKKSEGEDSYDVFQFKLGFGYNHQYARNVLQLNRGDAHFSEIGRYSGVHASDWSWSTLLFDFDGDGRNDIFVSNGIPKRMNDIDYINFAIDEGVQKKLEFNLEESDLELTDMLPEIKIENKFYQNTAEQQFKDRSADVAGEHNSFSTSAIYADLDLDGDLDIATNNVQQAAFIYENQAADTAHFLNLHLKGSAQNKQAIGAKAIIFAQDNRKVIEKIPVRGFQSSMDIPLHFSLPDSWKAKLDSIILVWPDNTFMRLEDVESPYQILNYETGLPTFDYNSLKTPKPYSLKDITAATGINFQHQENRFVDFNREPLMPNMVSAEGPALAIGDVDGNGLNDIFVGNAKRKIATLFLQNSNNKFVEKSNAAFAQDSVAEDVAAEFLDVDNNGTLDLIVGSGGNEYRSSSPNMKSRVYLNDGKGNFTRNNDVLPNISVNVGAMAKGDLNKDGFEDLIICGRAVAWKYGETPESYILINTGKGTFEDKTSTYSSDFSKMGMVQDAELADINQDGFLDVIVAMDWQPITIFVNEGGNSFTKKIASPEKGWWTSIASADFDQDGDQDFIIGNLGRNSKLKVGNGQTVKMYYHDFDNNETKDQVLTYYLKGKEIPFSNKMELEKQMPFLKKNFLYADDFAKANLEDLFGQEQLAAAEVFTADFFDNAILENRGAEGFVLTSLPATAQLTSYYATTICDVNNDNLPDVLLGGNFYGNNIQMGRMDSDRGTLLLNKGGLDFEVQSLDETAFTGEVKAILPLNGDDDGVFVTAVNNELLRIFEVEKKELE